MLKNLGEYKKWFDGELAKELDRRQKGLKKLTGNELVSLMMQSAATIALAGGKRIRPYLFALSFESFGGINAKKAAPVGVALGIELLHIFALAHDDVIDRGELRHNHPTAQVKALSYLKLNNRVGDLSHIANSKAILLGDLVLAYAIENVSDACLEQRRGNKIVLSEFFETIQDVVTGEMLDVELSSRKTVSFEEINLKHQLKTAKYSVVGPVKIGARLASGSTKYDRFAEQFGMAAGLAFQIQDDALDARSVMSGKPGFTDVEEGQHTYLTYFIRHMAKPSLRKQFAHFFGRKLTSKEKLELAELVEKSGGLEFCDKQAKKLFSQSRRVVKASNIDPAKKKLWMELLDFLEVRKV